MKTTVNAKIEFTELKLLDEQGCNSKVYLAKDHNLDAEIIIKEMKIKSDISNYLKEARILYSNAHPNIVKVQYAATDESNVYIGMPYYKKGSLQALMKIKNLTSREIIRYSIQFLTGLHHIHSNGLMHFDVKPNNILLSDRNEAMLSDFGLAKHLDANNRATPDNRYLYHLPPEANTDSDFSFAYDIYQSGVTMYRLCIGDIAFGYELNKFNNLGEFKNALITGTFPSKKYPSHISKKLQAIINKCLSVNPDDRYQSSLDLLNALSTIEKEDTLLDWRQEITDTDQIVNWNKEDYNSITTVTFNCLSNEIKTSRISKTDGKKRNVSKGTKNNASTKDLEKILREV